MTVRRHDDFNSLDVFWCETVLSDHVQDELSRALGHAAARIFLKHDLLKIKSLTEIANNRFRIQGALRIEMEISVDPFKKIFRTGDTEFSQSRACDTAL